MPGVLIIEAMAQAAASLSFKSMGAGANEKSVYYFAGIDAARFKRPVSPGRPAHAARAHRPASQGHLEVLDRGTVGERLAAVASMMCALRDARGMTTIHPTAIVPPEARLDAGVSIGAYSIVGPHVGSARECRSARTRSSTGRPGSDADNRVGSFTALRRPSAGQVPCGARSRWRSVTAHATGVLHVPPRHRRTGGSLASAPTTGSCPTPTSPTIARRRRPHPPRRARHLGD